MKRDASAIMGVMSAPHPTPPVAVILARGLGTRLRALPEQGGALDPQASAIAATGVKALLPDAVGRPFLDHVLTDLADAGVREVILVIGPEHTAVRQTYATPLRRLTMDFAIQEQPRGTADAVLAAAKLIGDREFLVLNSDNRYPVAALRELVAHEGPAVIGFHRAGLIAGGLPATRLAGFAVIDVVDGELVGLCEKPSIADLEAHGKDTLLSLNCWRFDHHIFKACSMIDRSPRGEFELPTAVMASRALGCRYTVIAHHGAVLDLSRRDDLAAVRVALAGHVIDL